jgi:hypothetical protein
MDTTNHSFQWIYPTVALSFMNFHSGDSIYVATYGTPEEAMTGGGVGDYVDPVTNKRVLTSYNRTPSNVVGLKIP